MGLIGCLTADLVLDMHGIDFTWEDNDDPVCAWRASTGGVFPVGDIAGWNSYRRWMNALTPSNTGPFAQGIRARTGEYAIASAFWHLSQHPPHEAKRRGARVAFERQLPNGEAIRLSTEASVHFNVQGYVNAVRERFAAYRVDRGPVDSRKLITHGFHPDILSHYVWGWSAKIKLQLPEMYSPLSNPCFYLRRGRLGDYAWRVPNGDPDMFNAGSARVIQPKNKAKSLPLWAKWERWRKMFRETMPDVEIVGEPVQLREGWRPVSRFEGVQLIPLGGMSSGLGQDKYRDVWAINSMGGSGLRLWWLVYDKLMQHLMLPEVL